MAIYITGGSGYIGTHLTNYLSGTNEELFVIDNNIGENHYAQINGVKYLDVSLHEPSAPEILVKYFSKTKNNLIIHLAGLKSIEKSIANPDLYIELNLASTKNLLTAMQKTSISEIIFASSAAVYGNQKSVDENEDVLPISVYGKVKLLEENLIQNSKLKFVNNYAILRFFNVVGAEKPTMREIRGGNVFPQIQKSIEENLPFRIFGKNFPTKDGTCVRDYVDVLDLVKGIYLCMETLNSTSPGIVNLGSGIGKSVLEIVEKAASVRRFEHIYAPPRVGDVPTIVSNITKAQKILKWQPRITIDESLHNSFSE
jgi:UDP-glucose 4-epimerase